MPDHMENSLIFHYNLKFYGDDKDNYEGVSLKRFVMQVRTSCVIVFFYLFCTVNNIGSLFGMKN